MIHHHSVEHDEVKYEDHHDRMAVDDNTPENAIDNSQKRNTFHWSKEELSIAAITLESLKDEEIRTRCKPFNNSERATAIFKELRARGYVRTQQACYLMHRNGRFTTIGRASANNMSDRQLPMEYAEPRQTFQQPDVTVSNSMRSTVRNTATLLEEGSNNVLLGLASYHKPHLVDGDHSRFNNGIVSRISTKTEAQKPGPAFHINPVQTEAALGCSDNGRTRGEASFPIEIDDSTPPIKTEFPPSPRSISYSMETESTAIQDVQQWIKFAEMEREDILMEVNEYKRKIREESLALQLMEAKLMAKEKKIIDLENILKHLG